MNRLRTAQRVAVVKALVEGNSIRSTVRLTGVAKNTVTKLLVELGMSYANMKAYFRLLRSQRDVRPTQIEWSVISVDRIYESSGSKLVGLQIADFVAGSFFCAVDSKKGQGVCDYAMSLRPVVYRRSGKFQGYGMKRFPSKCDDPAANAFLDRW